MSWQLEVSTVSHTLHAARKTEPRVGEVPAVPASSNAARGRHGVQQLWHTIFIILRRHGSKTVVVELFSGASGISRALRQADETVIAWDILFVWQYDITNYSSFETLRQWIRQGYVSFLFVATPRST